MKLAQILQYTRGRYEPWDGTPEHNCFIVVNKSFSVYDYRGNGETELSKMSKSRFQLWTVVDTMSEDPHLTNFKLKFIYED